MYDVSVETAGSQCLSQRSHISPLLIIDHDVTFPQIPRCTNYVMIAFYTRVLSSMVSSGMSLIRSSIAAPFLGQATPAQ